LDQPLSALEGYTTALTHFPDDTTLMSAIARVHEGVGNLEESVKAYRAVLRADATDPEAIASLAADHFYSDHPETALLLYRRLLQMGVTAPELFNNLALSCYYAQQYDMALGCFERAVQQADDDETLADVWYNVSHVGISLGDIRFAVQCLKLAVTCNPAHAEAFTNLGALEHRQGNSAQARAHYTAAVKHGEQLYEPHYNLAILAEDDGDTEACYRAASAAAELFPEHKGAQKLLGRLKALFSMA
jgi:tetratricopeptide repeat protein 8